MSYYVYSSHLSYCDYLQAKSFVTDVTTGQREIQHAVSKQTRELIASQEELQAQHMRVLASGFDQISGDLEEISYRLDDIHGAIENLNATFHWGFSQMLAGLGRLNDSLQELISIAKTPAQTWAYNQYEIARDAMRKQLYPEALESLNRAINGFGDNPGYKLEYRFHHTRGLILLGNVDNCDRQLLDLPQAEQAFLNAARYAKADYPKDAALAFLAAGWSAYCQGKMDDAAAHTQQTLALYPSLGEALFHRAKIAMHVGAIDTALPFLRMAITTDRNYSLKAAADGDFQKHSDRLCAVLDECRSQAQEKSQRAIFVALLEIEVMKRWHAHEAAQGEYDEAIDSLRSAQECFAHNTFYGYLDATPKATTAIAAAKKATQTQQSLLKDTANNLLAKVREIRGGIQKEAQKHAPSAWAEAEKEADRIEDRIEKMDVPPANYREWKEEIDQLRPALSLMEKAESLTRKQADECSRISAHNEGLLTGASETSLDWAKKVFRIVGVGCWIVLIFKEWGSWWVIGQILLGWIPAGIIGAVCGGVAWFVSYVAIHAGAGEKPLPPKN